MQRFLDPAVLARNFRPRSGRQDGRRRLRRRPAPLARFRLQPGVRRIPRLYAGRRSAPRGLERFRAHRARYLKRYRGETNSLLTVLLDASNSMNFSSHRVTKMDYARFIAASLFYLAIQNQRDAAGLIVFDDEVRNYIRPSTRQGQLHRLLSGLELAEPRARTDFGKPLHHFQEFLRRRGLVVIISDFYEAPETIVRTIEPLRFPRQRSRAVSRPRSRKKSSPSSTRRRFSSIWKPTSAWKSRPNTRATNIARKWTRTSQTCASRARAPEWIITCFRPTARSMARCANISRFARGGTRWAFSLPGSWRAQRRWACRSICICCGGTHRTPQPFSSLMFFEQRTQSSIKHRRLRYLLLLALRLACSCCWCSPLPIPFINRPAVSAASDKLLLLVVDNSFSMRAGTRLADAKREAPIRAGLAEARRARAGDGAWLAAASPHAADPGSRRAARRRRQHPARRFARQLRRTRARDSFRCAEHLARRSNCISSATCRSPTCRRISPSCPAGQRFARLASRGEECRAELDGRKRERARPGVGREESARAGRDRGLRHARRHAHGFARRQRQNGGHAHRRTSRPTAAPPSNSIRSTCPTASAAARCASIRPTPCRPTTSASSPSSAPTRKRCSSFTNPATRARPSISAPRSPRPPSRRSR